MCRRSEAFLGPARAEYRGVTVPPNLQRTTESLELTLVDLELQEHFPEDPRGCIPRVPLTHSFVGFIPGSQEVFMEDPETFPT